MREWFNHYVEKSLVLEDVQDIEIHSMAFREPWAQGSPSLWLVLACVIAAGLALTFYAKAQPGKKVARAGLAICRALLLVLLVLLLAEPILNVEATRHLKPKVLVVIDATESMNVQDNYSDETRKKLALAVGGIDIKKPSRQDLVKAYLSKKEGNLLTELGKKADIQVVAFGHSDGIATLSLNEPGEEGINPEFLAAQLKTDGKQSKLKSVFEAILNTKADKRLRHMLVFADWVNTDNSAPVGSQFAPVNRLAKKGVKISTVGVGLTRQANVKISSLDVPDPIKLTPGEESIEEIIVKLEQIDLEGREATVKLTVRPSGEIDGSTGSNQAEIVGKESKNLLRNVTTFTFSYKPTKAGTYTFEAEVEAFKEESGRFDNKKTRKTRILDDFLRLMYVEYEPTYEWRFIKEVFHRNKLVGMEGFRTFLRSADANVKLHNKLFLKSLTAPRKEFFETDVIFLGDYLGTALSPEFCDRVHEFVTKAGGGLVVIAGPRFGPGEIADAVGVDGKKVLADILPVEVLSGSRLKDGEFELQLTSEAEKYDFMKLGEREGVNEKAWDNLGSIPWYHPVVKIHELATVLAEHPTDKVPNTKSKQPLIAIREFPARGHTGHVVYIGFNEMWRLRRRYGEKYYTMFWGGMIKKLALSHTLGPEKRFILDSDKHQYDLDEKLLLTIAAMDENYEEYKADQLPEGLDVELTIEGAAPGAQGTSYPLKAQFYEKGKFTVDIPTEIPGTYWINVKDPVSGKYVKMPKPITVKSTMVEQKRPILDEEMAKNIALPSDGKYYTFETVKDLANDLDLEPILQKDPYVLPLWNRTLIFILACTLMLTEWFFRKMNNLA